MNPFNHTISDSSTLGVPDSTNRWFSHGEQRQYWPTNQPSAKKSSTKVDFPDQKRICYPAIRDPRLLWNCLCSPCSRKRMPCRFPGQRGCTQSSTHPECIQQTLQPEQLLQLSCPWEWSQWGSLGLTTGQVLMRGRSLTHRGWKSSNILHHKGETSQVQVVPELQNWKSD